MNARTTCKMSGLFLVCFILSGCWDRTELNDLALINALSIDKAPNNQVQVTAQVFIPKNSSIPSGGGGSGGGAQQQTTVRFENGEDTADALFRLQRKISRKLFWGQCKVIIFSSAVAKDGIRQEFDFLVRHPQIRERAYIFVSKAKASDALRVVPYIERSSAEALRELAKSKVEIGVTMEELAIMLKGDTDAAVIPVIQILPPDKTAQSPIQTIPYITGTAVFKKDKMVGSIPEKTTHGVMWLRNEIGAYTSTFQVNDKTGSGKFSIKLTKSNVKLVPKISGGQWSIAVKVKTEGDIIQNTTLLNPMKPEVKKTLERALANDIRDCIRLALDEVQRKKKVDVAGFASKFHGKYPKQWKRAKSRWDEIYPSVKVVIDVNARILRPGLDTLPGGVPAEEVVKQ